MKIIAVDDEKMALEILAEAIKEAENDAELEVFSNGTSAVEYLENNACDVCFLDIEMGDMTGIELAYKVKQFYPMANIIFVTGYSDYTQTAFSMRASGYVMKPATAVKIREELDNLRNPIADEGDSKIKVVTFGNFDIYVDGKPLLFKRTKSKEMLAYLIDRKGTGSTKREIAAILFGENVYDRKVEDYINKIYKEMVRSLKDEGISDILVKERNYYAIDPKKFLCDRYEFEEGKQYAVNKFRGEYMNQYSWAEFKL